MRKNANLIVGNWKLNPGTLKEAKSLVQKIAPVAARRGTAKVIICPPILFLQSLAARARQNIYWGAQDVFWEKDGPFTGEVSPWMAKYAGARYVIVGHSEKRQKGETDEEINLKLRAATKANLKPIFCVGERKRDWRGDYLNEIRQQIKKGLERLTRQALSELIIAYEPVWAIGPGAALADTPAGFLESAIFIRKVASDILGKKLALSLPILYGGSVNEKNTASFLREGGANGLLVGRSSLRPESFNAILRLA